MQCFNWATSNNNDVNLGGIDYNATAQFDLNHCT